MKKSVLFFLLATALISCKGDEIKGPATSVTLNFKAAYGGSPLVMFDTYTYPDGHLIKFQHFNFFISEVELLEENSSGVAHLLDVDFLDFSNNTSAAEAAKPLAIDLAEAPAGKYKAVRLSIGVPADLNKASSGQLAAGHPLRKAFASHFWSDWGSYIFMKSEGIYDLDNNGQFDSNDRGFEHHAGSNAVYQTLTIPVSIVLEENKPYDLDLVVDILKIYQGDSLLDLADPANKDTQEITDLPLAKWLTNNFHQAVSME